MPEVDFDQYDEASNFAPLPEGDYNVELDKIEEKSTGSGDEMWSLRFVVMDEPHKGRYIFDNMVFTQAAMGRVKLICSRLGINTSGTVNLTTDHLKGKRCRLVGVTIGEYEDYEGNMRKKNEVPFAGYEKYGDEEGANPKTQESTTEEGDDDLPF